ncbi:type II toxin-antitoxin system PemK/MazF family toxin, partial [bacterium]
MLSSPSRRRRRSLCAMRARIPLRRGQIHWVDWAPGRGSEQTGRRPALIIQTDEANAEEGYGLTIVATVSGHGHADVPSHIAVAPSRLNG